MEAKPTFTIRGLFLLSVTTALLQLSSYSQVFTPKASYLGQWAFAPGVAHKPSQSIYLIGTYQFGDIDQMLRYNVASNTWTSVPGIPAIKSEFGFAFGVNNRIFFGGGVDQPGTYTNQVYEFVPPNTFSPVDDIPNGPACAFSFSIGNYAYVGNGMVAGGVNANSMYRFDATGATGNQWSSATPYPGSGKLNCSAASTGGYGYAGLGRSNPGSTVYSDFWRYDPNTGPGGTWTAMTPFPGIARECAILTPICGKLVLMGGVNPAGVNFNDMWQFDPAAGPSGTWTYLGTNNGVYGPQNGRYGAAYSAYGDSLFLGMGYGALGANTDWKLFTVCAVSPLPVELINFSAAENEDHTVQINWATASEVNNHYFEIYHSTNAQHWELINRTEGNGNTSTYQSYQCNHATPANGLNYYQLKQFDFNGESWYSDFVTITMEIENSVLVYPNPVTEILNIIADPANQTNFVITNQLGHIVYSGNLQQTHTNVNMTSLPSGVYYLRLTGASDKVFKIIK